MAKKLRRGQRVTFDHHDGNGNWYKKHGTVLAVVEGPTDKDGAHFRATVKFGFLVITGIPAEEFKTTFNQNIRNLKVAK